jgi:hypothetical protein
VRMTHQPRVDLSVASLQSQWITAGVFAARITSTSAVDEPPLLRRPMALFYIIPGFGGPLHSRVGLWTRF